MFEYRPQAARGDPLREAASPQAPIEGLGNYTSGLVRKPRISSLGDMTRPWNDHKPGVLMDLLTSSMGAAILATEAIIVATHQIEGPYSPSMTHEQCDYK
jgi:hypothetical protein